MTSDIRLNDGETVEYYITSTRRGFWCEANIDDIHGGHVTSTDGRGPTAIDALRDAIANLEEMHKKKILPAYYLSNDTIVELDGLRYADD